MNPANTPSYLPSQTRSDVLRLVAEGGDDIAYKVIRLVERIWADAYAQGHDGGRVEQSVQENAAHAATAAAAERKATAETIGTIVHALETGGFADSAEAVRAVIERDERLWSATRA